MFVSTFAEEDEERDVVNILSLRFDPGEALALHCISIIFEGAVCKLLLHSPHSVSVTIDDDALAVITLGARRESVEKAAEKGLGANPP